MSALHWSAAYLGIPHVRFGRDRSGLDCWGLCHLVYREALGIDVPSYLDVPPGHAERAEMGRMVDGICAAWPWHQVDAPAEYDVAVFRMGELARHVGIVAGDGWMLHAAAGGTSGLVRIDNYRWRTRLLGYCRHDARMGGAS